LKKLINHNLFLDKRKDEKNLISSLGKQKIGIENKKKKDKIKYE
jgi:hypothetical protein